MSAESSRAESRRAATPHAVMAEIARRRSALAFDERPVEAEKLAALVEAARWAPSSGNSQPWRVTLVTAGEQRRLLNDALTGANRTWAPAAPLVVVYAARPEDDFRRDGADYYLFDCGLSAENLILQAEHMGLRAHPMVGWNEAAVREALGIPDGFRVVVLIAVGYAGDPAALPERLRERELRERSRRPLRETFSRERWGQGWE